MSLLGRVKKVTKNKFLKELDKSLYVLAESERQDIMNEYRDIIEEKMKHGKTEKEAVEEFGSIEELSREILSAYKVNPNYGKKEDDLKESAKKLGSDFDSFVKKGASKATEFTKELVEEIKDKNQDITIEFVFELLFKAFATLIIMFLTTIPFFIIRELGSGILNMAIYPINRILIALWSLLITVLFIGCCFLIFIAMFKQYFRKDEKQKVTKEEKETTMKQENKKDGKVSTTKSEEKKEEKEVKVKKKKEGTPLLDVFLAIAKAVLVIMMVPLIFFNIALLIGIIMSIYFIIKGITMFGILIGLIGLFIFFGYLQKMIFDIIFHHKKIHVYPYIIGVVLCIIGGVLCFDRVMSLNYYNEAPKHHLQEVTNVEGYDITTDVVEIEYWSDRYHVKSVVNNALKDNEMKITTTNYQGIINKSTLVSNNQYTNENNQTVETFVVQTSETKFLSKEMKEVWKLMIDNFNNNNIYNYEKLNDVEIIVETNAATAKKLRFYNY